MYKSAKKYDHGWDISVTDKLIKWEAPKKPSKYYEPSFEIDVEKVEKFIRLSQSRHDYVYNYLLLKNNCQIEINSNCGLSVVKFYQALEKVGIPMEMIYEKN